MVDKAKKVEVVNGLKQGLVSAKSIVVAQFSKLTIPETDELRKLAKKNNAKITVTKNRLAQVALKGSANEGISEFFKTQTIVTYSDEPLGTAKTLVSFAKTNEKLSVVGGVFEGKVLDLAAIQSYASVPSLEESRAAIVYLLNASASELVRVMKSYGEAGGAQAAAPAPAAEAVVEAAPAAPTA